MTRRAAVMSLSVAWFLSAPAFSRNENLEDLVEKSRVAMTGSQWEQALALHRQAIADFGGDDPLATFGPQFGAIHYRKGLCEMKLKRWEDAMRSFEICYRDFPNAEAVDGNPFEKMALLKWGEAAMGAQNWALAASCFNKFLGERERERDTFDQGPFYVKLAVCQYRLGSIAEGNENLEIAIRNKQNFPTPDVVIIAGFQALVRAALEARDEQALLDFIGKNRGELVIAPFAMSRYSPVFMKLAGDALGAELHRAALAIYQFVPSTDVAIDDIRARLKAIGGADEIIDGASTHSKAQLEQDLASLEAERRGSKPPETVKLAALAFLHESRGNLRGAFAAYQQLELYYPNAAGREDNLFHLVRVSSRLGPAAGCRAYAEKFLADFPRSGKLDFVRRLLVSSIYESADYETCITVAARLLDFLKSGSAEHDYCLHVLGASHYHVGRHEEAGPLLDRHVEEYPASESALAAAFYQASNEGRLGASTVLLDRFLAEHPDHAVNPFLPAALYERAAAAQPDAAVEMIGHIIREFPASPVTSRTYQLKGVAEEAQGKAAAAVKSYRHALKLAEKSGEQRLAGEVLYALVRLSAEEASGLSTAEAVSHADAYWKSHADGSPEQARMALAQVPPLIAAGRGEDALARLREMIQKAAGRMPAPRREALARDVIPLEESTTTAAMIACYATAYLKERTPRELKAHFENFPGLGDNNTPVSALLRMAVIDVFEDSAEPAEVKELFQQFKTEFAIEDLSSAHLSRVGDHLRLNTSTPREALNYYDEVIRRADPAVTNAAMLGRGDVLGRSAAAADVERAREDFTRVISSSDIRSEVDYASFRRIEILMAGGRHEEAVAQAKSYLAADFVDFISAVKLLLAQLYHHREMISEAVSLYEELWTSQARDIVISAPAMAGWVVLAAKDPAARRQVHERAVEYLSETREPAEKMAGSALAAWKEVERLTSELQANGD